MTIEEAADALGISSATAERYWTYARAWLYQAVAGAPWDIGKFSTTRMSRFGRGFRTVREKPLTAQS